MSRRVFSPLAGICVGMLAMYYLDPNRGRRRRALLSDKIISSSSKLGDFIDAAVENILGELKGLIASVNRLFRYNERVPNALLVERLRSKMGRCVSHPRAIEIVANDGEIVLRGPILEGEVQPLISCLRSVNGVRAIRNELSSYRTAENIPALQGGQVRRGSRSEIMQSNWSPAFRVMMASLAFRLVFSKRGTTHNPLLRSTVAILGGITLLRVFSNAELKRIFGYSVSRRAVDVRKTFNVDYQLEEVFEFWRNFENFPKFMPHLKEVEDLGDDRSRWVAEGPAGKTFEWTSVITRFEPNSLIAWKSESGTSVPNAGVVRFSENREGGTQISIQMSYNPPLGMVGDRAAWLFGSDLKSALEQGLLRLKSLLEEGKASKGDKEIMIGDLDTVPEGRGQY